MEKQKNGLLNKSREVPYSYYGDINRNFEASGKDEVEDKRDAWLLQFLELDRADSDEAH